MVNFIFKCTNSTCQNCGLEVKYNINDPSPCSLCRQPLQFIKRENNIKQDVISGQDIIPGMISGAVIGGLVSSGSPAGIIVGAIIGSAVGKSISEKERRKRYFGDL